MDVLLKWKIFNGRMDFIHRHLCPFFSLSGRYFLPRGSFFYLQHIYRKGGGSLASFTSPDILFIYLFWCSCVQR